MPTGPRVKTEFDLHWQRQLDHVRADLRDVYRRLQNEAEVAAFELVEGAYKRDGTLLDLRAEPGAIESIARDAVKQLPRGV